jgi:hypothetical protein
MLKQPKDNFIIFQNIFFKKESKSPQKGKNENILKNNKIIFREKVEKLICAFLSAYNKSEEITEGEIRVRSLG